MPVLPFQTSSWTPFPFVSASRRKLLSLAEDLRQDYPSSGYLGRPGLARMGKLWGYTFSSTLRSKSLSGERRRYCRSSSPKLLRGFESGSTIICLTISLCECCRDLALRTLSDKTPSPSATVYRGRDSATPRIYSSTLRPPWLGLAISHSVCVLARKLSVQASHSHTLLVVCSPMLVLVLILTKCSLLRTTERICLLINDKALARAS